MYAYPEKLFVELASEEKPIKQILSEYGIAFNNSKKDEEVLYDLIIESDLYANMREFGELILLDDFSNRLHISRKTAVAFVSQCAKAKKMVKS